MTSQSYRAFCDRTFVDDSLGFFLDVSRVGFDEKWIESMNQPMNGAFDAMEALERGEEANPSEHRRVGHYWLRDSRRAPDAELAGAIESTREAVLAFAQEVRDRSRVPPGGGRFTHFLLVGIGGSALGPQLVADALRVDGAGLNAAFLDNTDPDGMARVIRSLPLQTTLVVVTSKSGGTPETRNGMRVVEAAFREAEIPFAKHAVAVTGVGSALDDYARENGWLARFEMWDWVGGRTSVTSAVGLLPAALLAVDTEAFLAGARAMDERTRQSDVRRNPAALLALAWLWCTGGRAERTMVVLPYKDSLVLLSRYLQQLVMESLGKRVDVDGDIVHQGLTVYGNKGSTDQHAYVQQLRDGPSDFFASFIEVLEEGGNKIEVEPGITSGDYLRGFYLGTREALTEAGRPSLTIAVERVDPASLGALIALFERAVGLYATLVRVNAYDQPGVEAGKKAAKQVLELQASLVEALDERPRSATEVAERAGFPEGGEHAYFTLRGLAASQREVIAEGGLSPEHARFRRR